jgi:hypothetical protein
MRNGLAPSHQQFKPTACRRQLRDKFPLRRSWRGKRSSILSGHLSALSSILITDPSSIVAAVRSLTATLYPVNICSLLGFRFASVDGFLGHVAGIVMILPRLLFARLLLVWLLIVGHRHAPWTLFRAER